MRTRTGSGRDAAAGQAPGTGCPRGANHQSRKIARRSRHVSACAACATQARTLCSTSSRVTMPASGRGDREAGCGTAARSTPAAGAGRLAAARTRGTSSATTSPPRASSPGAATTPPCQERSHAATPRLEPGPVVGEQREVGRGTARTRSSGASDRVSRTRRSRPVATSPRAARVRGPGPPSRGWRGTRPAPAPALAQRRPRRRGAQRAERRNPVEQAVSPSPPHPPSASRRSAGPSR